VQGRRQDVGRANVGAGICLAPKLLFIDNVLPFRFHRDSLFSFEFPCPSNRGASHLQALFFVGLRESLVGLAVLCRQKQVNGFSKFPCDIVLDLGVRAAWLADRPLGRLCTSTRFPYLRCCRRPHNSRLLPPARQMIRRGRKGLEAGKRYFRRRAISVSVHLLMGFIIEAGQMYHCVAAVDEVMEHLREWALGELEITLFDITITY
jgi:hypothetical protein